MKNGLSKLKKILLYSLVASFLIPYSPISKTYAQEAPTPDETETNSSQVFSDLLANPEPLIDSLEIMSRYSVRLDTIIRVNEAQDPTTILEDEVISQDEITVIENERELLETSDTEFQNKIDQADDWSQQVAVELDTQQNTEDSRQHEKDPSDESLLQNTVDSENKTSTQPTESSRQEPQKETLTLHQTTSEPKMIEQVSVKFKLGLITRLGVLFAGRKLKQIITEAIEKMAIPGDNLNFTVYVSPSPIPNAAIYPGQSKMIITLGLLAFAKNVDEIAAVIGHEMTHNNREQLKILEDDEAIKRVISQIGNYDDRTLSHQEELRADIGSVERSIQGGYNPLALYNFFRRFSKWSSFLRNSIDGRIYKRIVKLLSPHQREFFSSHPLDEVRMQAVKLWVVKKMREDVKMSEVLESNQKFPITLQPLRVRTQALTLPLMSKWMFRAQLALMAYTLDQVVDISHLVAMAYANFKKTQIGGQVNAQVGQLGGVIQETTADLWLTIKHTIADLWSMTPDLPNGSFLTLVASLALYKSVRYLIAKNKRFKSDVYYAEYKRIKDLVRQYKSTLKEYQKSGRRLNDLQVRGTVLLVSALNFFEKIHNFKDPSSQIAGYDPPRKVDRLRRSLIRLFNWQLNQVIASSSSLTTENLSTLNEALNLTPSYALESIGPQKAFIKLFPILHQNEDLSKRASQFWRLNKSIRETKKEAFELWSERLYLLELRKEKLNSEEAFSLARKLIESGFLTTGYAYLYKNLSRIKEYIYSRANQNSKLADEFVDYLFHGMNKATLEDTSIATNFGREYRLVIERLKELRKPLAQQQDTSTTLRGVPIARPRILMLRFYLQKGDKAALRIWLRKNFKTLSELAQFIKDEWIPLNVRVGQLSVDLFKFVSETPQLFQSPADIDTLLANDFFWPKMGEMNDSPTGLEKLYADIMKQLREDYPKIWNYEPGPAERFHFLIVSKLKELNTYPQSLEAKMALWMKLTDRGVTSVTETLFAEIYKLADTDTKIKLEDFAIKEARIYEADLKAQITRRKIRESEYYKILLTEKNEDKRFWPLHNLIDMIKDILPERGIYFSEILEEVSVAINSYPSEARRIHDVKTNYNTGKGSLDVASRTLSELVEDALSWSKKSQWQLLQYLRQEGEPPAELLKKFRYTGPQKMQRAFQVMPLTERIVLLNTFLDSPTGLLHKVNPRQGWAHIMLKDILKSASEKEAEVSFELLEAFLFALKDRKLEALQSYTLSYLLALPQDSRGSPGDTLKQVLEYFGATGVKIGQFVAVAEILPEHESEKLLSLQDAAKLVERWEMYKDTMETLKLSADELPFYVGRLLGAASLKYAYSARLKETDDEVVIKVFRRESLAHTPHEFKIMQSMVKFLTRTKEGKRKYGALRTILRAAQEAVERELKIDDEVLRSQVARRFVYVNLDEKGLKVSSPQEVVLSDRLIVAEMAKGVSFKELKPQYQNIVANKILNVETNILFGQGNESGLIFYDMDRHAGNYRIHVKEYDNGKHLVFESLGLNAIDFGQLSIIKTHEREQIYQLFALAQVAKEAGSTEWLANKVRQVLGLDNKKLLKLKGAMAVHYPQENLGRVAAYYTLLSAIEDAGLSLGIQYFDFVRAIIQLNQYQKYASDDAQTPLKLFTEKVSAYAEVYEKEVKDGQHASWGKKLDVVWTEGLEKTEGFVAKYLPFLRTSNNQQVSSNKQSPAVAEETQSESQPANPMEQISTPSDSLGLSEATVLDSCESAVNHQEAG